MCWLLDLLLLTYTTSWHSAPLQLCNTSVFVVVITECWFSVYTKRCLLFVLYLFTELQLFCNVNTQKTMFPALFSSLTQPPWSWASWPRWGPYRWVPPGGWWSWPGASESRREPPSAWPSLRWHALPAGQSRSHGVWPGPSQSAPPRAASSEPGIMGNRRGKYLVMSQSTDGGTFITGCCTGSKPAGWDSNVSKVSEHDNLIQKVECVHYSFLSYNHKHDA